MKRPAWPYARALLGALLLMMAACAAPGGVSTSDAACRIERVAQVPIDVAGGYLVVSTEVNGSKLPLLLDTGAQGTVITPPAAVQAGLVPNPLQRTVLVGVGSNVTGAIAPVSSLSLGGTELRPRRVQVAPLPFVGVPIAGLLGLDALSGFDVELNVPARTMTLYRVPGCQPGFVPLQGPSYTLAFQRPGVNLVIVPVRLHGETVNAVLDSGARATLITATTAQRVGVTEADLMADPVGEARGVGDSVVAFRVHRFIDVAVGMELFRNVMIPVAPTRLPASMLLGADFLQSRRVWISFSTRQVFIQPVGTGT